MHHYNLMQQRNAQLQRRDPNHPPLAGPMNTMNPEGVMGQLSANVLAVRMHEEHMKHPQSMDSDASSSLLDTSRLALLKSPTNHQGHLVQGNPVSMSPALQPIQGRPQMATDNKGDGNLGPNQKSLPVDPSSVYGQSMVRVKHGLGGAGQDSVGSGVCWGGH